VIVAPPDARIIGSNAKCECQAFVIPGRVLCVQGHPEFNRPVVEFLLDNRYHKGLFSKDVYDEAFPHAGEEDDGIKVGEGILNFICNTTS
jgi:GMP synthase-like glutamine amidotransferase